MQTVRKHVDFLSSVQLPAAPLISHSPDLQSKCPGQGESSGAHGLIGGASRRHKVQQHPIPRSTPEGASCGRQHQGPQTVPSLSMKKQVLCLHSQGHRGDSGGPEHLGDPHLRGRTRVVSKLMMLIIPKLVSRSTFYLLCGILGLPISAWRLLSTLCSGLLPAALRRP